MTTTTWTKAERFADAVAQYVAETNAWLAEG